MNRYCQALQCTLNSRRSFAKMQRNYLYLDTIHIVEVLVICTTYHNLYRNGFIYGYKERPFRSGSQENQWLNNFSDKYSFSINCNFLKFYCAIVTEPRFVKAQDLLKEPWIINHFLAVNIHVYLFCGQMKQIVSGSELGNEYSHAYLI